MKQSLAILASLAILVTQLPAEARPRGKKVPQRQSVRQNSTQTKKTQQRTEKPSLSTQQQANINTLKQDLRGLQSASNVTPAQKEQLAGDLKTLAEGTQKPSQASVDKLANDLSQAMADGNLSKMEQAVLAQDVAAVMNSANIPPDEVQAALTSAQSVLESSNVDQGDVDKIMADLNAIASEMGASKP